MGKFVEVSPLREHSKARSGSSIENESPIIQFLKHCELAQNRLALATRDGDRWQELTYSKLVNNIKSMASNLIVQKLAPGRKIAIIAEAGNQFVSSLLANFLAGNTVIPIDSKLTTREWATILHHADADALLLDPCFDSRKETIQSKLESTLAIFSIEEKKLTQSNKTPHWSSFPALQSHQTAIINYTSGTTGDPKGVMLALKSLEHQVSAINHSLSFKHKRFLSVLPMNHMFELTAGVLYPLYSYSTIYIAKTLLPTQILDIFQSKKITHMNCVPLVLEAFRSGIERKIKKLSSKERLLFLSLKRGSKYIPLAMRKKIFKTIHQQFGGHFELFVSGGAPLSDETFRFFESLGLPIIQGYGLTETAPIVAMNPMNYRKKSSIGKALLGVDVKIVKKHPLDEHGVIWVKGPNVMQGYYKSPDLTKQVLKQDWFNTGDIGFQDELGYLFITGREKNLIVLPGGKKVHPEEVESVLNQSDSFDEVVVFSHKDLETNKEKIACVAVVAKDHAGLPGTTDQTLREEMKKYQSQLANYKWPHLFYFQTEELPKTTTKKIARNKIDNPFM